MPPPAPEGVPVLARLEFAFRCRSPEEYFLDVEGFEGLSLYWGVGPRGRRAQFQDVYAGALCDAEELLEGMLRRPVQCVALPEDEVADLLMAMTRRLKLAVEFIPVPTDTRAR